MVVLTYRITKATHSFEWLKRGLILEMLVLIWQGLSLEEVTKLLSTLSLINTRNTIISKNSLLLQLVFNSAVALVLSTFENYDLVKTDQLRQNDCRSYVNDCILRSTCAMLIPQYFSSNQCTSYGTSSTVSAQFRQWWVRSIDVQRMGIMVCVHWWLGKRVASLALSLYTSWSAIFSYFIWCWSAHESIRSTTVRAATVDVDKKPESKGSATACVTDCSQPCR